MFIDLFNLASFLIPREFLPKLTTEMKMRLATANVQPSSQDDAQEQATKAADKASKEGGFMAAGDFRPVTD